MPMIDLLCPECGSDSLATIESIFGSAFGRAVMNDDKREFIHEGWTEVWWDSSTTRGIECLDCFWQCMDGDYLATLKTTKRSRTSSKPGQ